MTNFWYYMMFAIFAGYMVIFLLAIRRQLAQRQKQINLLERIADALEKRQG
jgi:preprotein translocase subunit YajC